MSMTAMPGILLKEYLDEGDCAAIRALADECVRRDALALKLELDYKMQVAHSAAGAQRIQSLNEFMCFSGAKLIGYIGCGFGGMDSALEITGMVHPDHRRQDVFSLLYGLIMDECRRRGAHEVLALCDRTSASGQGFLRKIGAEYSFSEYEMRLGGAFPEIREERLNGVTLRRATNADAGEIARQNALSYDEAEPSGESGAGEGGAGDFALLPEDEEARGMTIYLAEFGETIIGKVHVETNSDEAGGIYGLVVLPEHRGKGFGRALLLAAIQKLRQAGTRDALLQVEAGNAKALGLYQSCGFQITSTMDYFAVKL